jgi:hypothetical protein
MKISSVMEYDIPYENKQCNEKNLKEWLPSLFEWHVENERMVQYLLVLS